MKLKPAYLITGAGGYLAGQLARHWTREDIPASERLNLRLQSRALMKPYEMPVSSVQGFKAATEWVEDCSIIFNFAGLAHYRQLGPVATCDFRRANVDFTADLALLARQQGVKRFVHISSIAARQAEQDLASGIEEEFLWAHNPYPISKLHAEKWLLEILAGSQTELIILRTPAIYGPLAPGYFPMLLKCLRWRLPLPFASLHKKRAYLGLGNFLSSLDCIRRQDALAHQAASYEIADAEPISLPELLQLLADATGLPPPCLLPCAEAFLQTALSALGYARLKMAILDTLYLNTQPFQQDFGWKPPFTLRQGLAALKV